MSTTGQDVITIPAVETFSTHARDAGDSVKTWREYLGEVYFSLDVELDGAEAVDGRLDRRVLDEVKISQLRASRQRMVRSSQSAKMDKVESFVVISPTRGTFSYRQRAREHVASAGQFFMLASSEYHDVAISDGAEMVCFEVPCGLMRDRIPRIDDFCAIDAFSDPLMVSLLRGAAVNILHDDSRVERERIESYCLNLVELAVSNASRASEESWSAKLRDDALYQRILQTIGERMSNPLFDLPAAAEACGVSKRHLQNVLGARNTSFSRELIDARLAQAARLVRSARGRQQSIAGVAETCGFASAAYFATCYRQRFGRAPRDDRAG